jgi:hypothetical protein
MSGSKIQGKITYLDVDSTFRDRQSFPNPADFKVYYSDIRQRPSVHQSQNALSNAYPYFQWQWGFTATYNASSGSGIGHTTFSNKLIGSSTSGSNTEIIVGNAGADGNLSTPASKTVTANYVNINNDSNNFAGLNIKFFKPTSTLVNNGGGYSLNTTSAMVVDGGDATQNLNIGDILVNADGVVVGEVTAIPSSTSITIGGGTQVVLVDDDVLCILEGNRRVLSYDSLNNRINVAGDRSDVLNRNSSNWVIENPSTSSKIFIPGGEDKDGHYVGDYYENLSYGSTGGDTNPEVHQFRKIIAYDGDTRLATLETALSNFANVGNKSGTQYATYLHRLRRGLPIYPTDSSSANNIGVITGASSSGTIYSVVIKNSGTGYSINDVLTISNGSNGKVVVSGVDQTGVVLEVNLVRGGSGYTHGSDNATTGGAGSSFTCTIFVGTGINVASATGISTTNDDYTDKILYCPAFVNGTANANTDPSGAQRFVPQYNKLDLDSTSSSYTEDNNCAFPILGHNFYTTDSTNEIVIKTLSSITNLTTGVEFNILDFKEDGVFTLVNNTKDPKYSQTFPYEIHLLNLTIPNKALRTGPGGFLANHAYVMVELYSESNNKSDIYNTNNPHLEDVMFKCMVLDTSNPSSVPFIKFRGGYPVVSGFKLNESVNFKVLMPNGETLRTVTSDNVPPSIPNKDLQISATFMLKRLE